VPQFYLTISALGYYVLSNRYTISAVIGRDVASEEERALCRSAYQDAAVVPEALKLAPASRQKNARESRGRLTDATRDGQARYLRMKSRSSG
jgi:hypothetical protein